MRLRSGMRFYRRCPIPLDTADPVGDTLGNAILRRWMVRKDQRGRVRHERAFSFECNVSLNMGR